MNDHDPIDDPADDTPPAPAHGELLPADATDVPALAGRDGAAVAHWLEQSHRDAAAGRAQARELVRTLEQVRDAHEYIGRALRNEQGRNRRLTAALALAPLLAGLLVWGIWSQLDALRSDLSEQVAGVADGQADLRRTQDGLAQGEAAAAERTRADALEAELARLRGDLDGERRENARRDEARAVETTALRARLAVSTEESAEAQALRAQLKAMRSRTGVEAARTAELERDVRRLERELGAVNAGNRGAPGSPSGRAETAAPPRKVNATPEESPGAAGAAGAATTPVPVPASAAAANVAEDESPPGPDPAAGAVRRPADLARIKKELNRLLALSADDVGYRLDMVGGVRGETLLDIRISGVDSRGRVVRTLEAPTATVKVRADEGDVLVDMRDGHLLLAGRRAPFFDGRYTLVVASDTGAWRTSGLTCVKYE